ncbi:hypothetical protein FRB93_008376, partial [Tulasnella sp. JGI-2019a]
MENAKQGLQLLSKALNAAPIPDPFKSAVTAIPNIAVQIIEIVDSVKGNVEDAKELAIYIANVTDKTMRPFKTKPDELDRSPDTQMRLEELRGVLEKTEEEMLTLMSRRLRSRALSYGDDASKLAAMKQRVDDAINELQLETVVAVGHGVDVIRQDQRLIVEEQHQMNQEQRIAFQEQEDRDRMAAQQQIHQQLFMSRQQHLSGQERRDAEIDLLINLLGTGDSGADKKPPCLAGTREHVLGSIKGWIDDTSSASKRCYLLLGPAGTGKSAIASSVAKSATEPLHLGGVFHFTREEQARNKGAILAVARQLASWGEGRLRSNIGSAIESAVNEGLDLARMSPENQFQKLILEPLKTLDSTSPTLVVVLDALDESDDAYATTLLRLLGGLLYKLPTQVKLLITGRGEPHLQHFYDSDPLKSQRETYSLGDEKLGRVEEDISLYFKERLPDLVGRWVAKPSNWPGEESRRALVHKTQGLFICATTVARMLTDSKSRNPEKQLNDILLSKCGIRLDDIYAQIIDRACPAGSDDDLLELFRDVLGTLMVPRVPINTHAVASLLSHDKSQHEEFAYRIRNTVLSYLQAVLIVPDVETSEIVEGAEPIRFIHTSFIDYLTDRSRCPPRFLLDLRKQHERLAIGCLQRMGDLKRNMCNLDPSFLNSEVEDLEQRIRDNLSPGLQYACANMPRHVSETSADSVEVASLVREFADLKLMYWLEALSLMGRVHEAVEMASLIETWLKRVHCKWSKGSPWMCRGLATNSLDSGKTLENRSYDNTLRLWDARTGAAIGEATKGHTNSVTCVAVSPDGTTIVSGSDDNTLCLWDARTGAAIGEAMKGHTNSVTCVTVSPDGITIVSGSSDNTLHLWDARTGAAIGEAMKGHTNSVTCVAVSPDGITIVSGSYDNTLCLWDARTGAAIELAMKGHTNSVTCVAVSPDGTTIVSGFYDNTLHLWDAKTGAAIGAAMGGSYDNTLHLWDARMGAAIGEAMKGHTDSVTYVAVSPDGTTIVSGSSDNTLHLWDARTGPAIGAAMGGHTNWVTSVAFSVVK